MKTDIELRQEIFFHKDDDLYIMWFKVCRSDNHYSRKGTAVLVNTELKVYWMQVIADKIGYSLKSEKKSVISITVTIIYLKPNSQLYGNILTKVITSSKTSELI